MDALPAGRAVVLFALLLSASASLIYSQEPPEAEPPAAADDSATTDEGLVLQDAEATSQRTELNLLGQVDSASGEAARNENVSVTLIDNNVQKELNQRMGATATIVNEFDVERNYFGNEYGGSPSGLLHVRTSSSTGIHGNLNWTHNNSIFKARSFFQVGGVQPSRSNDYGGTLTTPLWSGAHLTLSGGQQKNRGQVNGNILVPAVDERTPTATDPATRAMVERILAAYPAELPNRTDINKRALNTNAPQNIDDNRASAELSQAAGEKDHFALRYNLTLQQVDAFQLVSGQNPDTTTKSHDARITWSRVWNPTTTTDFSIGFNRVTSLLALDESALGTVFLFGRNLETLGPQGSIPLDRAQNTFRYAGRLQKTSGAHTLDIGFDLSRRQINGFESNDHRGSFIFRTDFGRDMVSNVLAGTPSSYRQAIGDTHRGFRVWQPTFFLGDIWRAAQRFTLNIGLRYEPFPRPTEVNGLSDIPFNCDCNNFAPTFGFAYRANDRWAVFRASYGLQYGEIFNSTFMQTRFNPPQVLTLNLDAPSLVNPLAGFSVDDLDPNSRTDYFGVDPELSTPYSHVYSFTWEMRPYHDWTLELGYIGSRSHKLLASWTLNRAREVAGVESTTSNVNERRPDARYSDVYYTLNGSRAFYDAAKITLRAPRWGGLSLDASYWWSKAIDLGGDYTNTGTGRDARRGRAPSEFDVQGTMKGLSDFDQTHAFLMNATYETGSKWTGNRFVDRIFGAWRLTGILLLKSGSPFTLWAGSDGPGFGNVDGSGADRPNVVDPSVLGAKANYPDTSAQALPRSAFGYQSPDQITGNLGRNTFRKDGVFNVNASLARRFPLRGDMSLQFQAESLNLLNHPQFEAPGFQLTEDSFGQITNTLNDGRTFLFTLSLSF